MQVNVPIESWAVGVLNKHGPDAVRILMDIIQAGLKNGEATANDVGEYPNMIQRNCIGATFKLLPYIGFVCDRSRLPVPAKSEKKHGRPLPVWILQDTRKAVAVMDQFRAVMMGVTDNKQGILL